MNKSVQTESEIISDAFQSATATTDHQPSTDLSELIEEIETTLNESGNTRNLFMNHH